MDKLGINKIFNDIYVNNSWIYKSGPGSDPNNAKEWIDIVNKLIKEKNIKSILDLGCGDWRIGSKLNLEGIKYTGVDVSDLIIEEIQVHKSNNINFICHDIETLDYPKVDLILIKDVLQHLPINSIKNIIDKILKNSKYSLICNDFKENHSLINVEINPGQFTNIDLHKDPFKYNFKNILDYKISSINVVKRIYLLDNKEMVNQYESI